MLEQGRDSLWRCDLSRGASETIVKVESFRVGAWTPFGKTAFLLYCLGANPNKRRGSVGCCKGGSVWLCPFNATTYGVLFILILVLLYPSERRVNGGKL